MDLLFLGTGAAFSLNNYQSNLILEEAGKRLLIDAGGDVRFSLKSQGLGYQDIDSVYVTHLHNDHIGGMEFLAFSTYFNPNCPRLRLYCHKWLLDDLWSFSLKGGLASIQGQILNIDDYFEVHGLGNGDLFAWEGVNLEIVQSVHVYNGYWVVPTFGLFISGPIISKSVYMTGDTQMNLEYLGEHFQRADLIIQDCETSLFKTGVHSHYDELVPLDAEVKAKMYLWHYQDNVLDDFETWKQKAHDDGFAGFLQPGERLTV